MTKFHFVSRRTASVVGLAALLASGCTASAKLGASTGGRDPGSSSSTGGTGGSGGSTSNGATGGGGDGSGGLLSTVGAGGGGAAAGEIFVHSLDTLYKFEPLTLHLSLVGPLDCVLAEPSGSADSGMHDIALDKDSQLFGVAEMKDQSGGPGEDMVIVSIDRTTGHCTKEIVVPKNILDPLSGVQIRGLSFVPAGTLDPASETLVALEIGGSYLRVDLASKKVSVLGNLNGDGPVVWSTKGADIVSIIGDKTYVTAKKLGEDKDRLAIMNPLTGAITQGFAPTNIVTIGGIAYWGGTLYAFTGDGDVFSIDPLTGLATGLAINGATPGLQFHGAGVTTAAPLTIPE